MRPPSERPPEEVPLPALLDAVDLPVVLARGLEFEPLVRVAVDDVEGGVGEVVDVGDHRGLRVWVDLATPTLVMLMIGRNRWGVIRTKTDSPLSLHACLLAAEAAFHETSLLSRLRA